MTKDKLLEITMKALPYSEQMKNFDTVTESDAVRFTWRSQRFRITTSMVVEVVEGRMLRGSDIAIVLEALIKRTWLQMQAALPSV